MVNQVLVDYIKNELARGVSKDDLKSVLATEGWSAVFIDEALTEIGNGGSVPDNSQVTSEIKNTDTPAINKEDVISDVEPVTESVDTFPEDSINPEENKDVPGDVSDQGFTPSPTPAMGMGNVDSGVMITSVSDQGIGETSDPTTNDEKKNKTPRSRVVLFGLIIVVLLLVGAIYYGYSYVYLSPESIVQNMVQAVDEVDSFSYKGNLSVNTVSGNSSDSPESAYPFSTPGEVNVALEGVVDNSNPDNTMASSTIRISTDDFNLGEQEVIVNGSDVYFRIVDLGVIGTLLQSSEMSDEWVKLEGEDIESFVPSQSNELSEVSNEDKMQIGELYKLNSFIEFGDKLPDENVGGIDSYHFTYSINEKLLSSFVVGVAGILSGDSLSQDEVGLLNETLSNIKFNKGEIWIGKDNYYPTGFMLNATLSDSATNDSYEISLNINFSNFNQPGLIKVPVEYISVDELLGNTLSDYGIVDSEFGLPDSDVPGLESEFSLDENYLPSDLQ